MILRRITEHVKAQNWFAVFLDFVIVVVGVFIGIQLGNWNDDRASRKQAALYSERLVADLKVEAWLFHYVAEYYDDVSVNAERALKILEGETNGTDEDLLVSLYRATQFTQNVRQRSTFDELVSAGAMGLIEDAALRKTAMAVYTSPIFKEVYDVTFDSDLRRLFRTMIPYNVQEILDNQCGDRFVEDGDYAGPIDSLDYPCETQIPSARLTEIANLIRNDPAFLRALRLHQRDLKTQMNSLTLYYPEVRNGLFAFREDQE